MGTRTLIKKAIKFNRGLIAEIQEKEHRCQTDKEMLREARAENRVLQAVLNSLRGNHRDLERYGE